MRKNELILLTTATFHIVKPFSLLSRNFSSPNQLKEEKMIEVNENYEISPMTIPILPAYHENFQSRILDLQGEFYSSQPPLKLIEKACLEGGSSLEGRKKSLQHKKSFVQCPPIPINPLEDIYTFPTWSPDSYECIWLFYEHIQYYHPKKANTLITFHNQQQLEVQISKAVMDKQMARTESCIVMFSRPKRSSFFMWREQLSVKTIQN
jgi:competence protein ComK